MQGAFITFEGGDRSGKTTQASMLKAFLEEKGCRCYFTREPGGTELGERIREILLAVQYRDMAAVTESLLYAAARSQLVAQKIRPMLDAGQVVICDRFLDSSLAYQGFGLGLDLEMIVAINRPAVGDLVPDLTFLLDVPTNVSAGRFRREARDRIEERKPGFHSRVRKGYLELAEREPQRFKVLAGTEPAQDLQARIRQATAKLLQSRGLLGPNGC